MDLGKTFSVFAANKEELETKLMAVSKVLYKQNSMQRALPVAVSNSKLKL